MPNSPTRTKTLDRTISSLVASTSVDMENCAPCQQRASEQTARTLAKLEAETFGSNPTHSTDPSVPRIDQPETAQWAGVLGFEGEMTGDGRYIAPNAITWAEDELPLPLRVVFKDEGAHRGAEVVGTIDVIERDEETGALTAEGTLDLGSEAGRETHRLMSRNMMNGVSLDLDDVSFEVRVAADVAAQTTALARNVDPEGADEPLPEGTVRIPVEADGRVVLQESKSDDEVMVTTGARARAATIVAVPAFSKARIALTNPDALAASGGAGSPSQTDYTLDDYDKTFNWVDDVGGLPKYIKRIADHLKAKGMTEGHAIATAVNAVKKSCSTGDLNYPGKQNVNAGSRAKACEAVASWEAKKAKARADAAMTDMMAVVSLDSGTLDAIATEVPAPNTPATKRPARKPAAATRTTTKEKQDMAVRGTRKPRPTARQRQARNTLAVAKAKTNKAVAPAAIKPKSLVADGWNPVAQARVPKGNGRFSGRWVDMPGAIADMVRGNIEAFEEASKSDIADHLDDTTVKALDKSFNTLDELDDVGPKDKSFKSRLNKVADQFDDAANALGGADVSEGFMEEFDPSTLADDLQRAAVKARQTADIDWSLYEEDSDIGAGDDDDFGDLETDESAPGFDTGQEYEPDAVRRAVGIEEGEDIEEGVQAAQAQLQEAIDDATADNPDVNPDDIAHDMAQSVAMMIDNPEVRAEFLRREGVADPGGLPAFEDGDEANAPMEFPPVLGELEDLAEELAGTPGVNTSAAGELQGLISQGSVPGNGPRLAQTLMDWMNRHEDSLDQFPSYLVEELSDLIDRLQGSEGNFSLSAAAAPIDPNLPHPKFFANPNLSGPTPLTVTDDGHVFGHIAVWGTCHISHTSPGKCVTPPKTASDYAYFHTGETVLSDGRAIATGKITLNTGHASPDLNSNATLAHYDNTGTAVADVRAGEDRHGLWVSGTLRPGLSPERVRSLRSSPISGDWRRIGGNLELVAALAVNVPGFPVPRPAGNASQGRVTSLVAAGMLPPKRVRKPDPAKPEESFSKEDLKYLIRLAREMKEQEQAVEEESRKATLAKASALANKIKAQSLAAKIKPNLSQKDLALTYDASTTSH